MSNYLTPGEFKAKQAERELLYIDTAITELIRIHRSATSRLALTENTVEANNAIARAAMHLIDERNFRTRCAGKAAQQVSMAEYEQRLIANGNNDIEVEVMPDID